jgi:hypothetical protein
MNQQLTEIVFKPYPKTPRLFGSKNIIVTEKIDGTNAAIQIIPLDNLYAEGETIPDNLLEVLSISAVAHNCVLVAQSRNRIITPKSDNFGFAKWVYDNAEELVEVLGTGIHRGEWYGSGIQAGYSLKEKRFALFAIDRYKDSELSRVNGLHLVPELYRGKFDSHIIDAVVSDLRENGSKITPGFKAEGAVVYHEASRSVFKVMCHNDDIAKGQDR